MRDKFFDALYLLMKRRKDVFLITSDTGAIVLDEIRRELGDRVINAGIAEENMIGVAAGMALSGKTVYCFAIIPFITMRCYEQVRDDLCVQNLDVKLIGVGPGVDYSTLGPTHHGLEDIALMRVLPNMTVFVPSDDNMARLLAEKAFSVKGPVYVRLDRSGEPPVYKTRRIGLSQGANMIKEGRDLLIIATGRMVYNALELAKMPGGGFSTGVMDLFRAKPVNEGFIKEQLRRYRAVATLEEHTLINGIGSLVSEIIAENSIPVKFKRFGLPDMFCRKYGTRSYQHKALGLDNKTVFKQLCSWLKPE